MITLASTEWVSQVQGDPQGLIVDPRTRMKYLAGHLEGAISFPMSLVFDDSGSLRPPEELAKSLGEAGVDSSKRLVLYDSHDGQKGAMAAWVLEYLGHNDIYLMSAFYDRWLEEDRDVFYRQNVHEPTVFDETINSEGRATAEELQASGDWIRLDTRSREEFDGTTDFDETPGHIQDAVHIDWREFVGRNGEYLPDDSAVAALLKSGGIGLEDPIVTYCASGPRASLVWLALGQSGRQVRLYDGSYSDWTSRGMPVVGP